MSFAVAVRFSWFSRLEFAVAFNPQNFKGTLEDMEIEGNFLRRSVNDITSLLDINFGSLGRPTRGGRGRGARGGLPTRLERPKPILERVRSQLCLRRYIHLVLSTN